jgi:hypothetical protein
LSALELPVDDSPIANYLDVISELVDRMWDRHELHDAPKGSSFEGLTDSQILVRVKANLAELETALYYDLDVEDKAADVANFLAYLLHNRERRNHGAQSGPQQQQDRG